MRQYLFLLYLTLIPFLALAKNDNFIKSASIIADIIEIDAKGNLSAKGNVKIYHNDNILKAQEIFYQRDFDTISVKGPLSLIDSSGSETKAESANFENGLQQAILDEARVILRNQLEITAEKLKYAVNQNSDFSRVTATSCNTCENETPFWLIKAKKVSHDKKLKTIYFYDASLEILGFPAFYTPYILSLIHI